MSSNEDMPDGVFLNKNSGHIIVSPWPKFSTKYIKASTANEREMLLENKITLLEEDIECAHMVFDDLKIPRYGESGKNELSLTGRYNLAANQVVIDALQSVLNEVAIMTINKNLSILTLEPFINELILKHKGE